MLDYALSAVPVVVVARLPRFVSIFVMVYTFLAKRSSKFNYLLLFISPV